MDAEAAEEDAVESGAEFDDDDDDDEDDDDDDKEEEEEEPPCGSSSSVRARSSSGSFSVDHAAEAAPIGRRCDGSRRSADACRVSDG